MGPSTRGVLRPIGESEDCSCGVVIVRSLSIESTSRSCFQSVRQTEFCELDFESILTLRFGVAHRRFACFAKVGLVGRLSNEHGLGLLGSPWLGPHAA